MLAQMPEALPEARAAELTAADVHILAKLARSEVGAGLSTGRSIAVVQQLLDVITRAEAWVAAPGSVTRFVADLADEVPRLRAELADRRAELCQDHIMKCPVCGEGMLGRTIHEVASMYACTHGHHYCVVTDDGPFQLYTEADVAAMKAKV